MLDELLFAFVGTVLYMLVATTYTIYAHTRGSGADEEDRKYASRMWLTLPVWPVWIVIGLALGLKALWKTANWRNK